MSDQPSIEPRSKVEVKTSTRGADITVTAYVNTTREELDAAGEMAVAEYKRVVELMSQEIMAAMVSETQRRMGR